jgi:ATP-dependent protease HslVU (ClpYQ) peptidase subunit
MTHVEQLEAVARKAQASLIIPTMREMPKVRRLLMRQIHVCDMAGAVARDGGMINDYVEELRKLNSAVVRGLEEFHNDHCEGI